MYDDFLFTSARGLIARLMQKLADASLLDSTLILTFSDMGNPFAHSMRNVPFMLLGATNPAFTTGPLPQLV